MTAPRNTLKVEAKFSGLGLHSGIPVEMTVHPGTEGIWFRYGSERTQAIPANVTDTSRCTKLGSIATIEHIMSALAGLEITDVEIEVTAPEIPGMDGSALPFVKGLSASGLEPLGDQEVPPLFTRLFTQEDAIKTAVAKGTGHWRFTYATGDRWPHSQSYESLQVIENYADQIAPARTFALTEELPMIAQLGLGKGLDENSAVIVGPEGYQNATRFPDELARHKLLDLMGDLYLARVPARLLSVVAERSGHRVNVKVAAMLYESIWLR